MDIKLYGRIIIEMDVVALTGLHIGGSSAGLEIGGIDNPVIRDAVTDKPYIPGSSLRGKMRGQLEKMLGLPQNNSIGQQVKIHTCKKPEDYHRNGGCPVCTIFGVPGEVEATGPTLLVVRDALLQEDSLKDAHTVLNFTELKTEVAIDRVTSAATPRNIERVPAGAVFGPVEMVFSIYSTADIERLKYLLDGLQLIEDDYLGGAGSRGSGKVKFQNIAIRARDSQSYATRQDFSAQPLANLRELEACFEDVKAWVRKIIPTEPR